MSRHCHLLGGMFALVVQLFLATICIIAAIVKRSNEKPRREWNIWTLDISKQFIGSSFGHFSNIGLSIVISDKISGYADECQWYCLAYVFDSVLGTFLNISILYGFERIIRKYFPRCLSLSSAGDYGIPPSLKTWFVQLFVWIIIITISKFGILLILLNAANPLNNFIAMIFSWFKIHPDLELIMVMVIMPGTFNTLQFWIQDTYIKKQSGPLTNHEIDIILTREDQLMSKVMFYLFIYIIIIKYYIKFIIN